MSLEQLAQPAPRVRQQGGRLWPLFEYGAAAITASGQSLDEPLEARGVYPRRAGEQRQVTVAISIILMEVQMNYRHLFS